MKNLILFLTLIVFVGCQSNTEVKNFNVLGYTEHQLIREWGKPEKIETIYKSDDCYKTLYFYNETGELISAVEIKNDKVVWHYVK